jgi:hypothetical protein
MSEHKGGGGFGWVLAAGAVAAYYFKDQILAKVAGTTPAIPMPSPAPSPSSGFQVTNYSPITIHTPGAVPLGDQGCFTYAAGTMGAGGSQYVSCPPGVSPPPGSPTPNGCQTGYTFDAAGQCVRYPDQLLIAQINTIPWTGLQDIPAEQIERIDPQILASYTQTSGVNPGTALAYLLGLGADTSTPGAIVNGSDGYAYKVLGGVFVRQGPGTKLQGTKAITRNLPITRATLIEASINPGIAALTGSDARALLTSAQWQNYETIATGIVQTEPRNNPGQPDELMTAQEYQRRSAALRARRLGTIRNSAPGAFPLGAINQWIPPGNRNIYRIPGRGAVPQRVGSVGDGGGGHRFARSPFPRPADWRQLK